jgi:hypothetical protein
MRSPALTSQSEHPALRALALGPIGALREFLRAENPCHPLPGREPLPPPAPPPVAPAPAVEAPAGEAEAAPKRYVYDAATGKMVLK